MSNLKKKRKKKEVKQNNISSIMSNIEDALLDLSWTNYYYQNRQ